MERTYFGLKGGELLAAGDTLLLHGLYMKVHSNGYIFPIDMGSYLKIYQILGIEDTRYDLARKCGYVSYGTESSPEFGDNLKGLTDFVIALYEMSPYNVGDTVMVNPSLRTDEQSNHIFGITDEMRRRAGAKAIIREIHLIDFSCRDGRYNGDPHKYKLQFEDEVNPRGFWWHTTMFTMFSKTSDKEKMPQCVSYDMLSKGYCLKPRDTLTIHGIDIKVQPRKYLYSVGESIFTRLGIYDKRFEMARECGYSGSESEYSPEFPDFQSLSKFTKVLFETPRYHPGDYVKILSKEPGKRYPFYMTPNMEKRAGRVYKITSSKFRPTLESCKDDTSGDLFSYCLDGDASGYLWHSSMFEKQDSKACITETVEAIKESLESPSEPSDEISIVLPKRRETLIIL